MGRWRVNRNPPLPLSALRVYARVYTLQGGGWCKFPDLAPGPILGIAGRTKPSPGQKTRTCPIKAKEDPIEPPTGRFPQPIRQIVLGGGPGRTE